MRSLSYHINQSLDVGCTQDDGSCGRGDLSNKTQYPLNLVSESIIMEFSELALQEYTFLDYIPRECISVTL